MSYVLVILLTVLLSYLLHVRTARVEREQVAEEKKWRELGGRKADLIQYRHLLHEIDVLSQLVGAYQRWALEIVSRRDGWRPQA